MGADSAHPGNGFSIFIVDSNHQIIGDGKNFGVDTISSHNAQNAFFHAEGLRTCHGKLIAKIGGQIKQGIVIHKKYPEIVELLSV